MNLVLLLELLIVVALLCALESSSFVEAMCTESSFVEAVESIIEAVDCCRLLCALESSNFVEAVESVVEAVVVEAVDCCTLESSSFVEAVESVVEAVDCCRLLC